MSKYRQFREGQRVVLKAKRSERWKEETGTVVSAAAGDDMYRVLMDKRQSKDDEGVRTIHASLLKPKLRIKYCQCGHSVAAHHSGPCADCSCLRFLDEREDLTAHAGSAA